MPIYNVQAPNGKTYKVEGPENATPNTLFGFVKQQVEAEDIRRLQKEYGPGVMETFGRGVKRGLGQLGSTITDIIPAMAGSALGFDEFAKEQMAEAEAKQKEREAEYAPVFRSYKEVEGLSDIPKFLAETIGEQVPNIATSLIPGVGAGALAARAGLTAAGKAAAVGAGTYLGSYAQNAPEIFQNIYEANNKQLAPGAAALFGAGSAALDSVLPARLAKQITGPMKIGIVEKVLEKSGMDKGLLRSTTAGVLGGTAGEGLTEGAQEAISIAAEKFVANNPQIFESKEWERIMESAVKGAVGGGAFGGVGGAVERGRAVAERQQRYQEVMADRNATLEQRRQAKQDLVDALEAQRAAESQAAMAGESEETELAGLQERQYTTPEEKAKAEKIAANKARQEEKLRAAQLKEDQDALKKAIAELTDTPKDLLTLAKTPPPLAQTISQARGEMETLAAKRGQKPAAPAVTPLTPVVQPAVVSEAAPVTQPVAAPSPEATITEPVTEPTIVKPSEPVTPQAMPTVIDDSVLKGLGVGHTALIRKNKLLEGKDIANPQDAAEVKSILEAYVENRSQPIREKVEAFLARPEFQGAPDVARSDTAPSGGSTGVVSEPTAAGAAATAETAQRDGDVLTEQDAGSATGGEGQQPTALGLYERLGVSEGPARENAKNETLDIDDAKLLKKMIVKTVDDGLAAGKTRQQIAAQLEALTKGGIKNVDMQRINDYMTERGVKEEATPEPVAAEPKPLGKRAKTDLVKAEAGTERAVRQQSTFARLVDRRIDGMLKAEMHRISSEAGVSVPEVESYIGSEVHNTLRLPQFINEFFRLRDVQRQEGGDAAQQRKNIQEMQAVKEAMANSGINPDEVLNQFENVSPARRQTVLDQITKQARDKFLADVEAQVNKKAAEIAAIKAEDQEKPKKLEGSALNKLKSEYTQRRLSNATSFVYNNILRSAASKEKFKKDINNLGPLQAIEKVSESLTPEQKEILRSELNFIYGQELFLPAYQGPAFDGTQAQLAQRGDVNGLLRNMLDQIKDPAIKQVLRRIRSLNLNVKVVIGTVEDGKAGSYDPATNTITLDPQNGLNAHTFIHEITHAAISNVLASPNHPLTKQFQQFFMQLQDRLGAAYGAQNLQEFAAELVGNPEFQAILKTIKAPRSGNMFQRIMQSIAEFFGFGKGTSAFDVGLKFIDSAIDISGDVEASASQKMFSGMGNFSAVGKIGQAMPNLVGQTVNQAKNTFSNIKEVGLLQAGFGMLRLDNLNALYKNELPSLQKLINALERRTGAQEQNIKNANDNYRKFVDIQKKHPQAVERMGDMAIDARLAEVDLLNPNFTPTASNQAEYTRLSQIFRSLPTDVQGMYRTMRNDYDASLAQYKNLLLKSVSPTLAQRLANEFQNLKGITGYVPFLRHGDFWVEYEDPQTGERAASAFESVRERQQFIDTVLKPQKIGHKPYQNLQSIAYSSQGVPATSFIGKVMNDLQKQGASQQQLDSVYQSYLTLFPGESILKQFMKAKNVRGMERDMVRNYGDIMVRWARKLANSEYTPEIDRALGEIATQGENSGNLQVEEAAKNILRQGDFFHNPTYNNLVQSATAFSYFEYIAGNISSALVNLTSLPMLVYPILGGKFGFTEAFSAMLNASRVAINGMDKNARYKKLYDRMMEHGQLQHTMAREILEGRRQTTSQYNSAYAKMMNALSIPFAASERYNRATTAIAAYDLAKANGMNEDAAIQYAINTTKEAHTSGLASTSPRWMQHPMGRVFFTFKSFAWNSAFVVARAFHQAYKGETPEVRRAAQKQLIGMYGMATVIAGVKGMPFYGAVSTLATMLNALFGDDEPFDFDEAMRDFFGELFFKGGVNYATNLEVANRSGVATDLIFRDDPRGIAEHGYVLSAMQQAFGPLGSYAVSAERGIKAMNDGQVERGVEALLPSWARNGLKGARYLTEGAVTMKGDPIVEDVSAYNSVMQAFGFAPANLSTIYEKLQAAKGYEREVNTKRTQLLNRYDMARHAGDDDMKQETREMIAEFNEKFPKKRITSETLQKSIAARKAAEKQMINGVRFDKKLMPEIREKFFSDEDED
jgi:hypothetical protein